MNVEELVDSLPLSIFNELRKSIIIRHQRHSIEIARALEYLASKETLVKSIKSKRKVCEKILAEKCNISIEISSHVIDRYINLQQQQQIKTG